LKNKKPLTPGALIVATRLDGSICSARSQNGCPLRNKSSLPLHYRAESIGSVFIKSALLKPYARPGFRDLSQIGGNSDYNDISF